MKFRYSFEDRDTDRQTDGWTDGLTDWWTESILEYTLKVSNTFQMIYDTPFKAEN